MKKYVTFVNDEEESRKVHEALYRAGFTETSGSQSFSNVTDNFIFIDPFVNRVGDIECLGRYVGGGTYTAINANKIISNPFQLDGAKQPEKMIEVDGKEYSASTIKAALQEYVK